MEIFCLKIKKAIKNLVSRKNVSNFANANLSNGVVAQLVEQRTENPRVAGSIPALGICFYLRVKAMGY